MKYWEVIEDENATWYFHPDIDKDRLYGNGRMCPNYDRICYVIERDEARKKLWAVGVIGSVGLF